MNHADFSWYTGNLTWLPGSTIFLAPHGSRAYGTATPTSDYDLKGVAIPPKKYFFGFLERFEQAEVKADKSDKTNPERPDGVIYDIRKFFKLAADANPTLLEMLFMPEDLWLINTQAWRYIYYNRKLFLSQKVRHTFSGYAHQQLNRIQTHRAWLLNPPQKHPERDDFGLPNNPTLERSQLDIINSKVKKLSDELAGTGLTEYQVESHEARLIEQVCLEMDVGLNLMETIRQERRYKAAMQRWAQYQKWKTERNPARSELEAKYGYDTKHGMHLVRLMRMGVEIIETGEVIVRRPDAEELLEIRNGAWSYSYLMEWTFMMQQSMELVMKRTFLPKEPDRKTLDELCLFIVDRWL